MAKRPITFIAAMAAVCGALLAHGAPAAEVIRIGGTGTGLGTMKQMIAAFEKAHPGVTVKLMPSVGSSGAIKAVSQGALDIGLNGRPLNEDERTLGLSVIEYAKTPFVFAAGTNVPVSGLSSAEIARIYRGEMTEWPNGERVRIVLRPAGDADTIIARAISPEMSSALDAALSRQGMLMAMTNQECHDLLARTPGSIGFSALTQIVTEEHKLKPLAYNGSVPGTGSRVSAEYPIMKTLSLIVKPGHGEAVGRFVRFVGSPEGRKILERTGNLPLRSGAKTGR